MMRANTCYAYQRNQCQERPLRETAAYRRNLAAVANRTINVVLFEYLNVALRLLGRNLSSGYQ
jgi:hypothetical protein